MQKSTRLATVALLCLTHASSCAASPTRQYRFAAPSAPADDRAALSRAMRGLAGQVMAALGEERDRIAHLRDLFPLQTVAGRYGEAVESLVELRALRRDSEPGRA